MKTILVPTDFSDTSYNALQFAVNASKYLDARIVLMHAADMPGYLYTDYLGMNREFRENMYKKALDKLEEYKSRMIKEYEVEIETSVPRGRFLDCVRNEVADKNVDLIIMGTLGTSGIAEKLWGSNTGNVIGRTQVPVLVVPHEYKWKKPEKIFLASKYLEEDSGILDFLFEMADQFMAQVQVGVFEDDKEFFIEEDRIVASGRIESYAEFLQKKYKEDTVASSRLIGDDFRETLEHYLEDHQMDMLVMITYQHEHDFWDRISYPSLTKRLSYNTTIPLLAIPANKG